MKKIACYDIDQTLAKGFIIRELTKFLQDNNAIPKNTSGKMDQLLLQLKSGLCTYETAAERTLTLIAESVRGQKPSILHQLCLLYMNDHDFNTFAKPTIALTAQSLENVIVTSEPRFMAQAVGKYLGINRVICSDFEAENDLYTGRVSKSLVPPAAKLNALSDFEIIIAFGDSDSDLDMLQKAKYPICINPSGTLKRHANKNRWPTFYGIDTTQIMGYLSNVLSPASP
jgi:phosphoserine phosphatase